MKQIYSFRVRKVGGQVVKVQVTSDLKLCFWLGGESFQGHIFSFRYDCQSWKDIRKCGIWCEASKVAIIIIIIIIILLFFISLSQFIILL